MNRRAARVLLAALAVVMLAWGVLRLPGAVAANLLALDGTHRVLAGAEMLAAPQRDALARFVPAPAAGRVLGAAYCAAGELAACEAAYRTALARQPADAIVRFRLANLLAATGCEAEALPLWAQAGAAPYWRAAGVAKGGCTCVADEGLCDLQRAVRIDPADGESQWALGAQLARCEEWDAARVALTAALDSDDLAAAAQHEALLARAVAAYHAGAGIAAAEADIARAAAMQPHNPWPYIRLCSLYVLDGQHAPALDACNRAVALAPDLGYAYYYRGLAAQTAGDVARARADYEQALALMPDLEAARRGLSRLP